MDTREAGIHEGLHQSSPEPNNGCKVTLDEDEESFYDLIPAATLSESEVFDFVITLSSSSSIPGICRRSSADELLDNEPTLEDTESLALDLEARSSPSESPLEVSGQSLDTGAVNDHPLDDHDRKLVRATVKNQVLTKTKGPSKKAMVICAGIIKFLFELPLEKLRSTFVSAIKSGDLYYTSKAVYKEEGSRSGRLVLSFQKLVPQRKSSSKDMYGRELYTPMKQRQLQTSGCHGIRDTSNSFGLSLLYRMMNFRSNPCSVVPSPDRGGVHLRDSSISDAIDHCKRSFDGGEKLHR